MIQEFLGHHHNLLCNQDLKLPQSLVRRTPTQSYFVTTTSRQRGLTSKERDELDLSLMKMVCLDFQPLSIVENKGFQEYTRKLQETILKNDNVPYKLPNRKTFTNNLMNSEYSTVIR